MAYLRKGTPLYKLALELKRLTQQRMQCDDWERAARYDSILRDTILIEYGLRPLKGEARKNLLDFIKGELALVKNDK